LLISLRNFYRPYIPPSNSAQQNGSQPWRQALLLQHKVHTMSCNTAGKTLGFPIMDFETYRDAIKDGKLLGSKRPGF